MCRYVLISEPACAANVSLIIELAVALEQENCLQQTKTETFWSITATVNTVNDVRVVKNKKLGNVSGSKKQGQAQQTNQKEKATR